MDVNDIVREKLKNANLSDQERKVLLSMLSEVKDKGFSNTYNDIISDYYREIPVDIETFLTDDNYLGKAWKDPRGKSKLYPFWLETLKKIFPNNFDTDYETLLESGARGIGKSEVACGAICPYLMYRVMCLKNPVDFYHLKSNEKIAFAFMNIKLDLAKAIAIDKFQKTIQASPWFKPRGLLTKKDNKDYWVPPEPLEIIIGSQSDDVIGRPIFFAFFDEISFLKNQDVEKQKKKATDMIDTAIGGMKTRFVHNGKNPTLLVVASSKRSEQSFMESYIRLLSETSKENTYIVDKPVWEVKPAGTYSNEKFWIGLGDRYKENVVIINKADLPEYKLKGYNIIEVPIDFLENALKDLNRTLCDYAGISSFSSNKFLNAQVLADLLTEEFKNPMPEKITVGDDKNDLAQYSDFFDWDKLDKKLLSKPLFIHLDMSISGDKTGIAGVWIKGKKPTSDGNPGKDLFFQPAFSFSVEAPHGRQISFAKNRNFLRWLKEKGFKIKHITSDTFQAYNLQQDLKTDGFDCSILSVDRVENIPGEHVGICKPYEYLRTTFREGRCFLYHNELLYNELVQLEKDNNNGKVDHPPKGCFTGDTQVALVDGRSLSFIELEKEYNEGKTNYVYSFNHKTKRIEPRKILKAWKTGSDKTILEITLDNDNVIKCTYNHLFMLRNGSYVEAKDLIPGDSLMPLYTKYPEKGALINYRMYYEPIEDKWHFEHRAFAKEIFDEKYLVHHKDFNKDNNNLDNLIWCSKKAHKEFHDVSKTGACSEQARFKKANSIKNWHKQHKGTIEYTQRAEKTRQSLYNHNLNKYGYIAAIEKEKRIKEIEQLFNIDYNNLNRSERGSLGVKFSRIKDPSIQESITAKISENHRQGKYIRAKKALAQHNKRTQELKKLYPKIDKETFKQLFNLDYDSLTKSQKGVYSNRYRQKLYELKNHKIISIRFTNQKADVYDIEVEHNHNFALASGIFVHNSKDQADALCGAIYTASSYALEYAHDYGEDLDLFFDNEKDVNRDMMKQMTVDFEEELKKVDPLYGYKPPAFSQKEEDDDDDEGEYLSDGMLIW